MDNEKPITAVIVGGGHRALIYADYSLKHPGELKIVGVADPNEVRRKAAAEKYNIDEKNVFSSAEELAAVPRFADAVINGTMDQQHFSTSVPLLEKGYDMLLEKPFAVNEEEMEKLLAVIKKYGNKVMICHILRYHPFYLEIKKLITDGAIGDIINIQAAEHVSFSHLLTSYVRGKWADSEKCKTSMLLAKSCHDMDIIMWLMGANRPKSISSFGSLFQFKPENAPAGAGTRCMLDCPYTDTCRYSAKKIYLEHSYWDGYAWSDFEGMAPPSPEEKERSMRESNPYGRCAYKCGNNVMDHQSVLINFSDGATATFNMVGGTAKSSRKIHITGTKGEISGSADDNCFTVSKIDLNSKRGFSDETVDLSGIMDKASYSPDDALTKDFVSFLRTGVSSLSCTSIDNSVAGHLAVFLADRSRENNGMPFDCDFSAYQM